MEEPASSPLEHVQRAALEIIGAARSALDILEDLVSNPGALTAVVNQVGRLAQSVVEGVEGAAGTARSSPSASPERQAVEHISIR